MLYFPVTKSRKNVSIHILLLFLFYVRVKIQSIFLLKLLPFLRFLCQYLQEACNSAAFVGFL